MRCTTCCLPAVLLVTLTVPGLAGRRFVARMALLALLFGLGLAHHRTIVLAVPGVAIYLLWSVPGLWRPRAAWLLWLAALLLPLLLYMYLPLRATAGAVDLHGAYTNTWNGFWDHVLARGYTSFFSGSALAVERTPQQWFALIVAQVGWVGLLLALVGCAWLLDRRVRKGWVLVLLVLAANFVFTLFYRVGDQEVFLIPFFLCLALLAGGGVAKVAEIFVRQAQRPAESGFYPWGGDYRRRHSAPTARLESRPWAGGEPQRRLACARLCGRHGQGAFPAEQHRDRA